jgi:hypothetical protein
VANIKETENRSNSQIKLIASIFVLTIGVSIVTSLIVVKTLAPTLVRSTPAPVYATANHTPTSLPTLQPQSSATLALLPPATAVLVQPQLPKIESNLLKNSGFEEGLSNWVYLDKQAGFFTYEIKGVNGKAFCSRRYIPLTSEMDELVNNEWEGISQEVLIDQNQSYFFSGWVKLNKAFSVLAIAEFYGGSDYRGYAVFTLATQPTAILPDGETTSGWFLIHGEIPIIPPGTDRAFVGFRHGIINNPPRAVDSTFCIDDLIFGQIVK